MKQDSRARPAPGGWSNLFRRLREDAGPPPRLVHEKRIQTWRARAYCDVLNDDEKFRLDLEKLLNRWTWTAAQEFARRWCLPERGLADLGWTHSLWQRGFPKAPRLQIGSRSYPGLEGDADEDEARRLGYRHHPPRLRDKESLRLGALRLYRRAVLEWPWERIAQVETEDPRWPIEVKTVWDDVHRWAAALGVPLPRVPRGRPRKSDKHTS